MRVNVNEPLGPQLLALDGMFPSSTPVPIMVDPMGFSLFVRPHTTDLAVVFDTFCGLYHLPPHQLPSNPVILDLGANIGCTMLHYALLYPTGRIFGIELDADNLLLARRNTAAVMERCTLLHAAAWGEDGFVGYEGRDAWGYRVSAGAAGNVPARRVPTLLQDLGLSHIDFLKIDVEGAEGELFKGDTTWLSQVDAVKIEIHEGPVPVDLIVQALAASGMSVWKDERHWAAVVGCRFERSAPEHDILRRAQKTWEDYKRENKG